MFSKYQSLIMIFKLFIFNFHNQLSKKAIIDDTNKFLVSITSYGERVKSVHYTIESIGRGKVKPQRIILWLSFVDFEHLPVSLTRLQKRGLEIKPCEDIKSYKKLLPLITIKSELKDVSHIVTADDDIVFSKFWLGSFIDIGSGLNIIYSLRARVIRLNEGGVDAYNNWAFMKPKEHIPSQLIFPTGGAGTAYPVAFLCQLESQGELFKKIAPEQDDVWFWAVALFSGFKQQYIYNQHCIELILLPGSQALGLWETNSAKNNNGYTQNDVAIKHAIEHFKLESKLQLPPS